MRSILPALLLVLACAGCNLVGASVGAGSTSGMGVSFSSYGDFLYSGPGKAYANNKKGLLQFLDKDYPAARQTFEATLESYPGNPDAVYYLGLTKIFLGEREAGYGLLRSYRDPNNFRISQEVVWWANYCAKKPELTPEKIREVLNKARGEGYRQQIEDERFRRGWY